MKRLLLLLAVLPTLAFADGRLMLGAHQQGAWTAVGRLNFSGSFCTAALVAPDMVVTAAHCLFAPRTGAQMRPERTHFVAGYRMRRYVAHETARRFAIHPDYVHGKRAEARRVGADLALVSLTAPISGASPFSMASGLDTDDEVSVLSYGRDRPEIPSLQSPCAVRKRIGAIAVLDCDVTYGVSGAPVFRKIDGEERIVAVISAMGDYKGRRSAFAVVLEDALPRVLRAP